MKKSILRPCNPLRSLPSLPSVFLRILICSVRWPLQILTGNTFLFIIMNIHAAAAGSKFLTTRPSMHPGSIHGPAKEHHSTHPLRPLTAALTAPAEPAAETGYWCCRPDADSLSRNICSAVSIQRPPIRLHNVRKTSRNARTLKTEGDFIWQAYP